MKKKPLFIIVSCVLIIFTVYFYISGLPHYTFFLIYKAVKNHDVEAFYKYVDVDSIIDNFMNDAWKEAMSNEQANELGALGLGIAEAMKPMAKSVFINLAKEEITNEIENIKQPLKQEAPVAATPIKYFMNRFKSLKDFSNTKIRTSGKVAVVEISSTVPEASLTIKMRRTQQRYWKIVAVQVPYISEMIKRKQQEDIAKANEEKLSLEQATQAITQKKITLPPVDLEKNNNPAYISYYQIVKEKIRRSSYQRFSGKETGEVYASFVVLNNGELKDVQIDDNKTNCSEVLKKLVISSIKEASPFPVFPVGLQRYRELNFNLSINFEVE